jgi:hypothetical protein
MKERRNITRRKEGMLLVFAKPFVQPQDLCLFDMASQRPDRVVERKEGRERGRKEGRVSRNEGRTGIKEGRNKKREKLKGIRKEGRRSRSGETENETIKE